MSKIISLGDSWAAGAELVGDEIPYSKQLSFKTGKKLEDFGQPGNSAGIITVDIFTKANIEPDDFVLICFPPDLRWYGETEEGDFTSLYTIYEHSDFLNLPKFKKQQFDFYMNTMLKYKNWGHYHFNLFVFSIQSYFNKIGTNYLMFHNYGVLPTTTNFKPVIDYSSFLSESSLTTLLGGKDFGIDTLNLDTDGPEDVESIFSGKYFEGKYTHPNGLGHKYIAELIYNNERFQKWLMSTTNTES